MRPRAVLSPAPIRGVAGALLAGVALLAFGPLPALRSQSGPAGVYRAEAVHAVFLVNFIRFTEWPAEALPPEAPFVVGVAGSRDIEDELIRWAEKEGIRGRRVRVLRVRTVRELEGCHVLYLNPSPGPGDEGGFPFDELLAAVRDKPVLTVSGLPGFLQKGGIVNFYRDEKNARVRFEIAPANARDSGLMLNSGLLALARIVEPQDVSGK